MKALLAWGLYEEDEARLVTGSLDPDRDVIELGASLGVVTCLSARKLSPARKLVSVEANPDLLAIARENARLNGVLERITFVQSAISVGQSPSVSFAVDDLSLCGRLSTGEDTSKTIEVPAIRLSALQREHNIDSFSLVSDIEGAEADILLGDSASLASCRQMIIELHDTTFDGRTLREGDLVRILESDLGFSLRSRARNTYLFERD